MPRNTYGTFKPNQLRDERTWAGLTQAEAAARAGISQPNFNNYESGKSEPDATTLRKLAAAVGCETTDLNQLPPPHTVTLAQLRYVHGFTQQDIADRHPTWKTARIYSYIEQARTRLTPETVTFLATLLNTPERIIRLAWNNKMRQR